MVYSSLFAIILKRSEILQIFYINEQFLYLTWNNKDVLKHKFVKEKPQLNNKNMHSSHNDTAEF